jgi:hypothetical protein
LKAARKNIPCSFFLEAWSLKLARLKLARLHLFKFHHSIFYHKHSNKEAQTTADDGRINFIAPVFAGKQCDDHTKKPD